MKANEFTEMLEDFRTQSLINKTTTTVFLISANSDSFSSHIDGYQSQIRNSMVEILVDNPTLIRVMDGACRRARAVLKEKFKNEDIPQAR